MVRAETDRRISIQSAEFVWSEGGLSEAHQYILPILVAWLSTSLARRVLDIGSGNGALTNALCEAGFEVTGIEVSASGIEVARKTYPQIPFIHSAVETPLEGDLLRTFDAVVSVEVVEHLCFPRLLLRRAKEALRIGGSLILTTPYHGYLKNLALALTNKFDGHWHPLRDHGHVKFFSIRTLSQLLVEQGFRPRRAARVGRLPQFARSMIVEGTLE
jgi:2-polyprenyl-3-methyl-5-hydroxy-6-metoxy-1,4-benzoquinol methylase